MSIWEDLGVAPGSSPCEIRLAYARRVKQVHPEDDPQGFQRLRQAYELALRLAQRAATPVAETGPAPPLPPVSRPAAPAGLPEELRPPPPAQAAAQLFQQLLGTTASGRRATLEWQLRQANWINLDFVLQLETAVAEGLATRFEELQALVALFADHYGWSEPPGTRQPPALTALMRRHAARRRLGQMEQSLVKDPVRRRALHLLLAPPRRWAFRRFALWSPNLRSMQALLEDLQANDSLVWQLEVDQDAARWWARHLQKRRYTLDRFLTVLVLSLLLGPLCSLLCFALCAWLIRYDPLAHPVVAGTVLLLSIATPMVHDLILHRAGR
jgi:hypothetical protein